MKNSSLSPQEKPSSDAITIVKSRQINKDKNGTAEKVLPEGLNDNT